MKKRLFIIFLFASQMYYGQYYTFQAFADYEDIVVYNSNSGNHELVAPFHNFISQYGYYDIEGWPDLPFEDDPSGFVFQVFIEPQQADVLEDMLANSSLIYKYSKYEGVTDFLLDRLMFGYHVGSVPEYFGIIDGVPQTDYEPLNVLFEHFQVDGYQQTFPYSSLPILLAVYHIRCNGCNIFDLYDAILKLDIVNSVELVGFVYLDVDDFEVNNSVKLVPNPNNGNFNIHFDSDSFMDTEYSIFDSSGRKIYENKIFQITTEVRLQEVKTGVYFIRINSGKNSITKKMIVNPE